MGSRNPLLNKKVRVEWVESNDNPCVLYVAYLGDSIARLVNNYTWSKATWDKWVPLSEIASMEVMRDDTRQHED